jgi:hypothetical protein
MRAIAAWRCEYLFIRKILPLPGTRAGSMAPLRGRPSCDQFANSSIAGTIHLTGVDDCVTVFEHRHGIVTGPRTFPTRSGLRSRRLRIRVPVTPTNGHREDQ